MNIVIIGMRGCGKSTVGKMLAKNIRLTFIDIDKEIEKEHKKSINEIICSKGWVYFRKSEETLLLKYFSKDHQVIATGGGAILHKKIFNKFKHGIFVIWLKVGINTLMKRLDKNCNRPRLTKFKDEKKELSFILKKRGSLYQKFQDLTILNNSDKPWDMVKLILGRIR